MEKFPEENIQKAIEEALIPQQIAKKEADSIKYVLTRVFRREESLYIASIAYNIPITKLEPIYNTTLQCLTEISNSSLRKRQVPATINARGKNKKMQKNSKEPITPKTPKLKLIKMIPLQSMTSTETLDVVNLVTTKASNSTPCKGKTRVFKPSHSKEILKISLTQNFDFVNDNSKKETCSILIKEKAPIKEQVLLTTISKSEEKITQNFVYVNKNTNKATISIVIKKKNLAKKERVSLTISKKPKGKLRKRKNRTEKEINNRFQDIMKNKDAASFSGTINDLKNRLLEITKARCQNPQGMTDVIIEQIQHELRLERLMSEANISKNNLLTCIHLSHHFISGKDLKITDFK